VQVVSSVGASLDKPIQQTEHSPSSTRAPDLTGLEGALFRLTQYYETRQARRLAGEKPTRAMLTERLLEVSKSTEELAQMLYGDKGAKVLARLKRIGPGFDRLVHHPGLVIRLAAFESFVRSSGLRHSPPEIALEAFRQKLGTATVFRAVALTDKQLETILKQGLESDFGRHDFDLELELMPEDMREKKGDANMREDRLSRRHPEADRSARLGLGRSHHGAADLDHQERRLRLVDGQRERR
jgi:hypothetical protein